MLYYSVFTDSRALEATKSLLLVLSLLLRMFLAIQVLTVGISVNVFYMQVCICASMA